MTTTAVQHVPAVGDTAPDFTLASTSGKDVTLSSFKGQKAVLLAFFPLAFTSTCTAELCEMRDAYDELTGDDVVIFPVSVDSVPTLKEFKAKHGMQVEMLSDFKREVSRKYGVLLEERFFSNRAYFLIDKSGIIRWAHVEANPGQKRENREIMAELAKLR